jgi:hypothetical protein
MALTLYFVCDEVYEFRHEGARLARVFLSLSTGPYHTAETTPVAPADAGRPSSMVTLPVLNYEADSLSISLLGEIDGARVPLAYCAFPVRAQRRDTCVRAPFQLLTAGTAVLPARPKIRARVHLATGAAAPFAAKAGRFDTSVLAACERPRGPPGFPAQPPAYAARVRRAVRDAARVRRAVRNARPVRNARVPRRPAAVPGAGARPRRGRCPAAVPRLPVRRGAAPVPDVRWPRKPALHQIVGGGRCSARGPRAQRIGASRGRDALTCIKKRQRQ